MLGEAASRFTIALTISPTIDTIGKFKLESFLLLIENKITSNSMPSPHLSQELIKLLTLLVPSALLASFILRASQALNSALNLTLNPASSLAVNSARNLALVIAALKKH